MKILEQLAARKAEVQQADQAAWSKLVTAVHNEALKNADEILAELERLGRTPEELAADCELLESRRGWAVELAAGRQAENDHAANVKAIDEETAAFKRAQGEHEARLAPLRQKRDAGVQRIDQGDSARKRLLETVSDEARDLAIADIDARFARLEGEKSELQKRFRDREDWVHRVEMLGESATSGDIERLPAARAGLTELRDELKSFAHQFETLNSERTAALEALLNPEVF